MLSVLRGVALEWRDVSRLRPWARWSDADDGSRCGSTGHEEGDERSHIALRCGAERYDIAGEEGDRSDMTQRQGQGYGGALADPRDERFARAAWGAPRFEKGDRIMVGVGTEDPVELLVDATGYDDSRHVPLYVTINAAGVHQYADQAFIDEHAELAAPLPSPVRPSPMCTRCGRDEGDDVGVVIEGACGDCRAAWG